MGRSQDAALSRCRSVAGTFSLSLLSICHCKEIPYNLRWNLADFPGIQTTCDVWIRSNTGQRDTHNGWDTLGYLARWSDWLRAEDG